MTLLEQHNTVGDEIATEIKGFDESFFDEINQQVQKQIEDPKTNDDTLEAAKKHRNKKRAGDTKVPKANRLSKKNLNNGVAHKPITSNGTKRSF